MWQRLWAGLWKIKYRSSFYLDKACVFVGCHYAAVEKTKTCIKYAHAAGQLYCLA